jgi:hypothetical protein
MFSPKIFSQIFIALILIATAWLPAKAQSEAESIVERWVESAGEYSFVNISYGSIDHDKASNITTINNLKVEFNKDAAEDNDKIKSDEDAISGIKSDKFEFNFKYTFDFPIVEFDNLAFDAFREDEY